MAGLSSSSPVRSPFAVRPAQNIACDQEVSGFERVAGQSRWPAWGGKDCLLPARQVRGAVTAFVFQEVTQIFVSESAKPCCAPRGNERQLEIDERGLPVSTDENVRFLGEVVVDDVGGMQTA